MIGMSLASAGASDAWHGRVIHPPRVAWDFVLTNTRGEKNRLSDFRGRLVLVMFGFARCPSVCPLQIARVGAALRELPADVEVLFIGLDREDTQESLAAFLQPAGPAFTGLLGSPKEIQSVARAFDARFQGEAQGIDHSTDVSVIDRRGRLRVVFSDAELADTRAVASDLKRLLAEEP